MATEFYKQFIDRLCTVTGLGCAEFHYSTMDLVVDGINFALVEAGNGEEEGIAYYCDFGAPPKPQREKILERLLQANLSMHGINTPVFMLNQENGHVLLGRRIPIGALEACQFLTVLAQAAVHAKAWRDGFYLQQDKPQTKPQTGRRTAHEDARFRRQIASS